MNTKIIIILIIQIILFIVGLFIIFFKSYFKKKGENIATKEDIGLITKEIENIKNEISFKNQKKIDFFFERKKNLINFYDYYFIWVNGSLNVIDHIISHSNDEKVLRELITQLKSDQIKVFTYFTRIFLYEVNTKFTITLNEIYNKTISLHNLTLSFLVEIECISIQYENLIEKSEAIRSKVEKEKLFSEFDKLKKDRKLEIDEFLDKREKLNEQLEKNKLLVVKIIRKEIKTGYV